ncbi:hypothetical protein CSQ96_10230 [Janthinobacterium sp. BJB412]|nr:hypothetical protein CSQ96_10230 [Janthinobacterium sp. BJB412]
MNARKLIASLTLFAATGLAYAAADTPAAAPAATATATASSSAGATELAGKATATAGALLLARANRLNDADVGAAPARTGAAPSSAGRSRAEVRAEAVEALKQHRSTLAEDLQLSNN